MLDRACPFGVLYSEALQDITGASAAGPASAVAEVMTGHPIGRATDASRTPVEDVGVDHRRADVPVTEQLLDSADVVALFQEVSGERMAEGVARTPSSRSRTARTSSRVSTTGRYWGRLARTTSSKGYTRAGRSS